MGCGVKFLSKSACEIAQRLGMVSESGHYWLEKLNSRPLDFACVEEFSCDEEVLCSAFTEADFTGSTPQARKNAELLWPSKLNFGIPVRYDTKLGEGDFYFTNDEKVGTEPHIYMRHQVIDSEDGLALIEKALMERGNNG